jgi:hypothetical protein
VFDREEDALQFHASWSAKSTALSRQSGRRVLTVIGDGQRGPAMLELMAAEPVPAPGETDAATTAAIEAKMLTPSWRQPSGPRRSGAEMRGR